MGWECGVGPCNSLPCPALPQVRPPPPHPRRDRHAPSWGCFFFQGPLASKAASQPPPAPVSAPPAVDSACGRLASSRHLDGTGCREPGSTHREPTFGISAAHCRFAGGWLVVDSSSSWLSTCDAWETGGEGMRGGQSVTRRRWTSSQTRTRTLNPRAAAGHTSQSLHQPHLHGTRSR